MVSMSNGGFSHGNPNKRLLENGYHSSNSGNAPKYKFRKVSAVRDFPPMCGHTRPKSEPEENGVVPVGENAVVAGESNGAITENGVQNQPHDGVKSPVGLDANGFGTSTDAVQTETAVEARAPEVMRTRIEMETDESGKTTNSENRENVVVRSSDNAFAAPEPNVVKVEAVGSPYGVEGNESLDKLVEKVVAGFAGDMDNGVEQMASEVNPIGVELAKDLERKSLATELSEDVNGREAVELAKELSKEEGAASVKNMGEDGVKPSAETGHIIHREVPIKGDAVPSPKNKFRRRRVSAVRDFPPHCGRNSPSQSKHEKLTVTSEKSLLVVDNVNAEKGMIEMLKDGADSEALNYVADIRASKEILPTNVEVEKSTSEKLQTSVEVAALPESVTPAAKSAKEEAQNDDFRGSQARGMVSLPKNLSDAVISKDTERGQGSASKVLVLFEDGNNSDGRALDNSFGSGHEYDHVIETDPMAAPNCPQRRGEVALTSGGGVNQDNGDKIISIWRGKCKAVAKKSIARAKSSGRPSLKKSAVRKNEDDGTLVAVAVRGEKKFASHAEELPNLSTACSKVDVNLPPFGPSSCNGDARNKVRETLRLFQALCRKLLQGEESRPEEDIKSKQSEKIKRIDLLAAKIIKERGKEVNTGKQYLGAVPGVEAGDEFQYRVELALVGVHRLYQAGIDYMKHDGMLVATSIVASGGYDDDTENADVLIYSGQGGNLVGKDKQPEDQKLERGNLALWNSISSKNPVRVIRGSKETKAADSVDSKVKVTTSYVYDGLYTVENCREETGTHGKKVFMFELKRIPGQPELALKEVKKSKKSRVRYGVCVDDIAGGQESLPICAVNRIDNEKPEQFNYIKKMRYPDWFHPIPPKGCDCTGKCTDSRKCSCAQRNGGEIPYNRNGAIVEAKPLVYECGPHCKCPPSCYNRVTQHGIKIQLEIFKTESRGWGVRSLYSIPSGSFICEYVGELLEDKEAELRAGSDEYLFDIGKNNSDCSLNADEEGNSSGAAEEGSYTIDAAKYGNIGRFINHSCSPNLYAQDVIYDHDDKKIPHIMLFAAENIPPLQELTYHYNYIVGEVHDSNGNVKMKSCYCGSTECTGRMY